MFKKVRNLYIRKFYPLAKQAKLAGVSIGNNNYIASRFWDSEPYLISIGNNCQITAGVKIFTHGGGQVLRNEYPDFDCFGKVKIGSFVYLGNNVLIMPGVTIGDHVLVAAGSVVTKSIPSRCVVGGNPARFICTIDEYAARNLKYNVKSKGLSLEEKKLFLLAMNDSIFISKPNMVIK